MSLHYKSPALKSSSCFFHSSCLQCRV